MNAHTVDQKIIKRIVDNAMFVVATMKPDEAIVDDGRILISYVSPALLISVLPGTGDEARQVFYCNLRPGFTLAPHPCVHCYTYRPGLWEDHLLALVDKAREMERTRQRDVVQEMMISFQGDPETDSNFSVIDDGDLFPEYRCLPESAQC